MVDEKPVMSTCTMPISDADPGVDLHRWHHDHDRAALERLMAASLDRAYSQARWTLGNAADAHDAVQEALLQIMHSAHRYDPARPFAPWLARHVHDACCRLRWRARRAWAREQAVAQPTASAPGESLDHETVRASVAALPERDRAAIELHYWAGLSQAETARELGVSENALAVRLHRARERLRGLLERRGIVTAPAGIVVILQPTTAWTAPPTLAASVHGLGQAATLPATTMPLGLAKGVAWTALHHPWWLAAGFAVLLGGGLGLGALLRPAATTPPPPRPLQAEMPPPPLPAAPGDGAWDGPARTVLRWLDPRAQARIAVDLTAFRQVQATTRPLSLFADPEAQPALTRLCTMLGAMGGGPWQRAQGAMLLAAAGSDGVAFSFSSAEWAHLAFALSDQKQAVLLPRLRQAGRELTATPAELCDPGWFVPGSRETSCFGLRNHVLLLGAAASIADRITPAAAGEVQPELPAAAWLRVDFAPLIAAYAAASPGRSDPAGVSLFLGPGWRSLAPQLTATVAAEDGQLTSTVRLSGAVPSSPLAIGLLVSDATGLVPRQAWPFPPDWALRLRPATPARLTAPPREALLWATVGIERASLARLANLRTELPELDRLLPELSGDICLIVEPGVPLPAVSLVLGLAGRSDQRLIGALCNGLGAAATPPPAGCRGAWQAFTTAGQVQVLLAEDRLVLSTSSDPGRFLVPATAASEAPLVVHADLPRLMSTYGPLLLARLRLPLPGQGQIDASVLPPPTVLARHLAPWHVTWTPTADGCLIREQGLPLASAIIATGALQLAGGSNPGKDADQNTVDSLLQLLQLHRRQIAAADQAAMLLASGSPFTAEELQLLRPLCDGRLPSLAEAAALGQRYPASGAAPEDAEPANLLLPMVKPLGDGRHVAVILSGIHSQGAFGRRGLLAWAMPLGDGWSLGVVDGTAGLFRGDPPAAEPPAPAAGDKLF